MGSYFHVNVGFLGESSKLQILFLYYSIQLFLGYARHPLQCTGLPWETSQMDPRRSPLLSPHLIYALCLQISAAFYNRKGRGPPTTSNQPSVGDFESRFIG